MLTYVLVCFKYADSLQNGTRQLSSRSISIIDRQITLLSPLAVSPPDKTKLLKKHCFVSELRIIGTTTTPTFAGSLVSA